MNALTRIARGKAAWSGSSAPTYRFYSPKGGIEASGCFQAIETPAGEDGHGVEREVAAAFAQAKAAGLNHPMVVGVIPFDKQQPSSLFVPRHVSHLLPVAPPTRVCGFPCGKARQCTEQPDQFGFKQAVGRAVEVMRGGQVSKVVLSRLLQLEFDNAPCAATVFQGLRQQNPEAYHFSMDLPDGGVLIGMIAANAQSLAPLKAAHGELGVYLGPDDVFLTLRGLRTMPLRLREQGAV